MRVPKPRGPESARRPFHPTIDPTSEMEPNERVVEALEHIAVSLSAIDHNLETLTNAVLASLKQR